jgi:hypothetical protein
MHAVHPSGREHIPRSAPRGPLALRYVQASKSTVFAMPSSRGAHFHRARTPRLQALSGGRFRACGWLQRSCVELVSASGRVVLVLRVSVVAQIEKMSACTRILNNIGAFGAANVGRGQVLQRSEARYERKPMSSARNCCTCVEMGEHVSCTALERINLGRSRCP